MEVTLNSIKRFLTKAVKSKDFSFDAVMEQLKGFKAMESPGSGHEFVYIDKKNKIVVKMPYLVTDGRYQRYKVKTHVVKFESPSESHPNLMFERKIFIQPMIDMSRKATNKAYTFFRKKYREGAFISDIHRGNVGMFEGKPVRHDW